MRPLACKVCHGARLKPESLSYRIGDKNIADLVQMDLGSLQRFLDNVEFDGRQAVIARPILKGSRERSDFLIEVGGGYLSLDRAARPPPASRDRRIRRPS